MELLSPEQRQYAYNLGIMDKALDGARKNSSEVLQNGKKDAKIINNKESGKNEQGVRLRDGSERDGGQDPGGEVSAVESGARQDQSRDENGIRPRDREAASLTYGKEVSAKSLGIKGGLDSGKVYLIAEGNETTAMKKARKRAEKRGKKVTFFAGGNLEVELNGETASVRGYIKGDDIYIRVDHPYFTSDQLMRHELGHDMIANGEVDITRVRERIEARYEDVDFIVEQYSKAYEGSGLDADEIWEEIICDSLGDMNAFASVEVLGEMNDEFLEALKEETRKSQKDARGPPRSAEGKASRESRAKGADYLTFNFSGFVREGKGITLTKSIKGRIASAVKTGNGALNQKTNIGRVYISDDVNFYLFRYMQDSGDIVVIDILSENLHKNTIDIIEETLKNGNQRERNNSNVSEWIESFWIRQGNNSIYSGSNASSYGTNGGTNALYGNSSNSKSLRNREAGVGLDNNSNQLTSHLPVKQKFVDISGRHRNVLGIGDGIYVVQDTKKTNYKFNSIEEAISAENENIIQRYARKNNRSVTWVKNKLSEDSDFLVKERRKGKASQDLDFVDFLNENIEERERSNREVLANLLETEDMSPSEKGFLTKYKNKIAQIEANEAEIAAMESELKELRNAGKKDSSRAITLEGKIEARRKEIARDENMILNLESTKPMQMKMRAFSIKALKMKELDNF